MTIDRARAKSLVAHEADHLADLTIGYPANHFAWRVVLASAEERGARSLVEIGVGGGNGVPHVLAAGLDFAGVDNNPAMVDTTRRILADLGGDPDAVIIADAEDPASLSALPGAGSFDTLVGLGIMPHAHDQEATVANLAALVRPGGELFLEFRNSMFSLVTFNRFTTDFITDDLLQETSSGTRVRVREFVADRVDMNRPPLPSSGVEAFYDNPLALVPRFQALGYEEVSVHPFHYHAGMPALESADPRAFRDESLALEDDDSGWRGLFLCSAFLLRLVRPA
ncbi:MAG TPA: hypothetical protein DCQ36_02415 [Actinobacteria bacterium]|jgi:SAM-dependent methyltransferase|nr:hypothetical protein [Actinomycetota bacterium]